MPGYFSPTRHRFADSVTLLARLILGFIFAESLPVARATFSIARCCTLAVREEFHKYYTESYPWQVCNFNTEINYGNNETFPSIMRNMTWAKEFCQGTQYSSLKQWLLPLSTYISPYVGVLMLTPIGDVLKLERFKLNDRWSKVGTQALNNIINHAVVGVIAVINVVRQPIQGYGSLLGDPASAMFGAFHEIGSDANTLRGLDRTNKKLSYLHQRAIWITALAGDIRFTAHTGWHLNIRNALSTMEQTQVAKTLTPDNGGGTVAINVEPKQIDGSTSSTDKVMNPSTPITELAAIDKAIKMIIVARISFVTGILIPIVLMLAVTAATFYDAYSNAGDKDTALDLAYCVWYSWILVLGVSGNCFASSLSPEVARRALKQILQFAGDGKQPLAMPLRNRFVNNYLWDRWARDSQNPPDLQNVLADLKLDTFFWLRYCTGQLLGFCAIAFTSACATAIAWTTPTVGLGCRSFNFILYVILSFVIAYLHVFRSWLRVRNEAQCDPQTGLVSTQATTRSLSLLPCVNLLYSSLVLVNALVFILGTLFHLVGVFRTCWCERLTSTGSVLIELNSKTAQAYENARRYWLSTAYIAFGIVWLTCLTAIAVRSYIVHKMDEWADGDHEDEVGMAGVSQGQVP